jgi:hypothetical protein
MACCNEKRKIVQTVKVEYRGNRQCLRLFGGVTGRTYEFNGNGDILSVDPRDLPFITHIPGIMVVSH